MGSRNDEQETIDEAEEEEFKRLADQKATCESSLSTAEQSGSASRIC
jgi:hypothetical protein